MGRVVPDVLQADGQLGVATPKYLWQSGWNLQHNRLLQAASAMRGIPLFLSGDLHAFGQGQSCVTAVSTSARTRSSPF